MILVTGATGMFGSRVLAQLATRGAEARALVHSEEHAAPARALGVDVVIADLDDPVTLPAAFAGVDTVFLVTPMDDHILERESNALAAAEKAGVRRIVKLLGAVRHQATEELHQQHVASLAAISASGLRWARVSPNSVMETSLLGQASGIIQAGMLFGCAGDGRVGFVAADDIARATAVVLMDRDEQGADYQLTGPAALSLADAAAEFTRVLGRPISYQDMPESDFRAMLVADLGVPEAVVDSAFMVHFAAWKRGDADLVTDTYSELTGLPATSLADWIATHRSTFVAPASEAAHA